MSGCSGASGAVGHDTVVWTENPSGVESLLQGRRLIGGVVGLKSLDSCLSVTEITVEVGGGDGGAVALELVFGDIYSVYIEKKSERLVTSLQKSPLTKLKPVYFNTFFEAEACDVTEFLEALRLPGEEIGEELLPSPPTELVAQVLLGLDL